MYGSNYFGQNYRGFYHRTYASLVQRWEKLTKTLGNWTKGAKTLGNWTKGAKSPSEYEA